ncbi:Hsp33 family molecular chaperone HslO [Rheinheimera sp.]|uniref:Hsp33 family molecular chaperone HslO n=1 Tax=Rheinheimera sp. TaxID=1869214 RepID=UPI0026137C88|nr:Hsp33 family molecular chaperone HslO [Rheinheimera sp.]MCA1931431.1 Hsp33 family molecular chaperone HslO [Rheinheimera sp.]
MNQDLLVRFLFNQRDVRGEIAYTSDSLQQMLQNHDYPYPVKQLLAELVVATSLLTATLKLDGDIAVQLQGDGPVRFAAVNGTAEQEFRGVARLQAEIGATGFRDLIGEGYMLVTITPKQGERYQGIIPLTGDSLTETLEAYFAQSEQLPTRLYLFTELTESHSRAAGLLLQVLPVDPEKAKQDFSDLVIVTDTITSSELLNLPTEQMLHRLYHDEEVELFAPQAIRFVCGCSREKCEAAIISLGKSVIEEHIAEGKLEISCDYCNSTYLFDSAELSLLLNKF